MFKEINILRLFFEESTREFNVREIARILKISPAAASYKLKALANKSLLRERKERMLILYKANLESELYQDSKVFYNVRKIKESGLIKELNKFYLKPTIILFGSITFGLDTETSDIDLLIISEKKKEFTQRSKFEKKLNRPIQILIVKEVKELKNKHLISNIINGIVLQGKIRWT